MEDNRMNILFVAGDDGGCGFYRCQQPSKFLERSGLAKSSVVLQNPTPEQLLAANFVVMQYKGTVEAGNIGNFLIEHKIPFALEIDDYIHHVSPNNTGGYPAWNPSTLWIYRSTELMRKANAIIVSTPALGREYFPYNKRVYVMPNYLDKDRWDIPVQKRMDGKIRIGWCGGNAHGDDLKMISKVIEKIVKEYDGKVIFETLGMVAHELQGVFGIPHTSDTACPSCNFEGTLHHLNPELYDNFPSVVAFRGWDLVVAPVIDNGFGNAKSDLKLKEYASLGYPAVASNVASYREAQEAGAPVLLARTFEDWYGALKSLIDEPVLRRQMQKDVIEWSSRNWIQDHISEFFGVYRDIHNLSVPVEKRRV